MRHYVQCGLLLLLMSIAPTLASAAIYKWVEDNGTVTFRDTPPPPGKQAKVIEATETSAPVNAPPAGVENSGAKRGDETTTREVKKPAQEGGAGTGSSKRGTLPKVELYVTSWCGYCKKARSFLTSRGIPFEEYDIERDAEAAKKMASLNRRGGVPVAVIGGKTLVGFSPEAYQSALGTK